jgi:signal transduction histidine kinase
MVPESDRESVTRLEPRSMLVLPLAFGDRVGGALTVGTSMSGQEYGTVDADLFRQIARQAGLALTNATILTETKNARLEREEVLAIVSHDLKNPLNVLGFASTLLLTPGIPEERKKLQIEIIERAVRQMDELINNLLDAARIDAGRFSVQPRPLDAAALVQESVQQTRPLAEKEGVLLRTELEPGLPPVMVDRERILRVFGNLIVNAISFTPPGGTITMAAKASPGIVEFEVRDTGPGIEPEALANIFDRYFQARRQGRAGTGLGLTIVRGIVQAHGGHIGVESELGAGTTFRFSIPAVAGDEPTVHATTRKDKGHGDGPQIGS